MTKSVIRVARLHTQICGVDKTREVGEYLTAIGEDNIISISMDNLDMIVVYKEIVEDDRTA